MTADRFEEFIQATARDYNRPPETPRDAMWTGISERLGLDDDHSADDARVIPMRRRWRHGLAWGVALAAGLAIGFGLGRITGAFGPTAAPGTAAVASAKGPRPADGLPYRLAAAEHLGQAETMLTMFRSTEEGGVDEQTVLWARDLLGTTRLLLDSPAAEDARMKDLLQDLELILVQIASLPAGETGEEAQMARHSMEERDLLLKLRAVPNAAAYQTGT